MAYPNIVRRCVSVGRAIYQPDCQMYDLNMPPDVSLRGHVPAQGSVIGGASASISAILDAF